MEQKRILVCEFRQESNTFNPIVTPMERFNDGDVFEGEELFEKKMTSSPSIKGAVTVIRQMGGIAVPTVMARCGSAGPAADALLEHLIQRMRHYGKTESFDAIYACLHGATCTETVEDACGAFLEVLREIAGDRPIAASCDLHAKITEKMLKNADFICGYHTYPHVDLEETGARAAKLCMRRLNGEEFRCAVSFLPMLVPPAGYTTLTDPFKSLMDRAVALVKDGILEDFSIFPVQPWLDVKELRSSVLAIAKDEKTALEQAGEIAKELFSIRDGMWPDLYSVDEILDLAEKNTTGKPVILADSADSPNGGAVGDSPVAAIRWAERKSPLKMAMFLRSAPGVAKAFELGVGGVGDFCVGAEITPALKESFCGRGEVLSLHENDLNSLHPEMGRSAVVRFGTLTVVLSTNGSSCRAPQFYRDYGMDPMAYDLLVVKANTSFRAHYVPISDLIYVADTPGAGASNLKGFEWKKIPKGTYPFDLPSEYQPGEARLW